MWTLSSKSVNTNSEVLKKSKLALAELFTKKEIGFYQKDILEAGLKECVDVYEKIKGTYEQVAVIGIGGSSLGAQALIQSIKPEKLEDHSIIFFDNVDAKSFYRRLEKIKDSTRTLWVVISKSGGTIETLSQTEFIEQYLQKKFSASMTDNTVVITEKKSSALNDWASINDCKILEVPKSIGGRYSVLTPVGLFPAICLGIDVKALLSGAKHALESQDDVCEILSQFCQSQQRQEWATYFFHYCDDLSYWGLWTQQLWAESLGKRHKLDSTLAEPLSVPLAARGSTDQHSVLQQIAEGNFKKFVCFLRVGESEKYGEVLNRTLFSSSLLKEKDLGALLRAEVEGTQQALSEANVNNMTLQVNSLNESSMGYLFMLMELVVSTLGIMYQIDPFNQPGVERSKVIARTILR